LGALPRGDFRHPSPTSWLQKEPVNPGLALNEDAACEASRSPGRSFLADLSSTDSPARKPPHDDVRRFGRRERNAASMDLPAARRNHGRLFRSLVANVRRTRQARRSKIAVLGSDALSLRAHTNVRGLRGPQRGLPGRTAGRCSRRLLRWDQGTRRARHHGAGGCMSETAPFFACSRRVPLYCCRSVANQWLRWRARPTSCWSLHDPAP
jgi:hypothetical protein